MAYTAPRTWVTGELVTAALLNEQIRDNTLAEFPLGVGAWTSYTPTLTQSATVAKTVTYARYQRVGRIIFFQVRLDVTGAGTAANDVLIGLPVAAVNVTIELPLGGGFIYDSSLGQAHIGVAITNSGTVVKIRPGTGAVNAALGNNQFTAALASGDIVSVGGSYEAAT